MATVVGDSNQQPIDVCGGGGIAMRARPETRIVPNPSNFQIPEIRGCYFVTVRITRIACVTTKVGPISVLYPGQLRSASHRQSQ